MGNRVEQLVKRKLKKIQHQPGLMNGCLAETGLILNPP
jgi:hypothetical protein